MGNAMKRRVQVRLTAVDPFNLRVGFGVDELEGNLFIDEVLNVGGLVSVVPAPRVFELVRERAGSIARGQALLNPDGSLLWVPFALHPRR